MQENTDQKKICIWTLFTQCLICHCAQTGIMVFKGKAFSQSFYLEVFHMYCFWHSTFAFVLVLQVTEEVFRPVLNEKKLKLDVNNAESLQLIKTVILIFDKHAPKKQKYVKTNNSNFMDKDLRKEIMHLL